VVVHRVLFVVLVIPAVTLALMVVGLSSSRPKCHEGRSTGVRKTMMQTTATRQPAATASSLRLCSSAANRTARKNPLIKKNRAMLTELLTRPAYQNAAPAGTRVDRAGARRGIGFTG